MSMSAADTNHSVVFQAPLQAHACQPLRYALRVLPHGSDCNLSKSAGHSTLLILGVRVQVYSTGLLRVQHHSADRPAGQREGSASCPWALLPCQADHWTWGHWPWSCGAHPHQPTLPAAAGKAPQHSLGKAGAHGMTVETCALGHDMSRVGCARPGINDSHSCAPVCAYARLSGSKSEDACKVAAD